MAVLILELRGHHPSASREHHHHHHHHHHHQITKLSHSINAIGPAPHRGGRKREHRSIVFATITHIPSYAVTS
jgi:hypothetical protein